MSFDDEIARSDAILSSNTITLLSASDYISNPITIYDYSPVNFANYEYAANGSLSAASANAVGTLTSVPISTGGITINLLFNAASMAAPAAFRAGIEQAATQLANVIKDKITVNLTIDYSGTGGGADAGPATGQYINYSTVRANLINKASPGDLTFNALPNSASIQGQSKVAVWNAQLKLFGLLSANDTTNIDGTAHFTTDLSMQALVGVALHELTHAMGRIPYGPAPDIFDLFRFSAPGVRMFADGSNASPAYFSIDGGATKLADYGQNSDPSDFLNSGVQGASDPFNEYYTNTTTQKMSAADLEQLDALGFHLVSNNNNLTISLKNDSGVSSTDNFTNTAVLTGQATANGNVWFTENGSLLSNSLTLVNGAGVWTYTPTLADGQHTIYVTQKDATGQYTSAKVDFSLATKAPAVTAWESVSGATNQTSNVITVSATPETVGANKIVGVEVFDGNSDLGSATLNNGLWTFTAYNLLQGPHNFVVKATDQAGNVGAAALAQVVVNSSGPTTTYTLTKFDFVGAGVTDTRAKSINDLGEIVGYYMDGRADEIAADGQTYFEHGFYSTLANNIRKFTSIDNPDAPIDAQNGEVGGIDRTRAFGVNNNGDIVGWYSQDEKGISSAGQTYMLPDAGFIMSAKWPGTFGTLTFSALNDFSTHALGINSTDQIVGWYNDGSGVTHGFLRNFSGYGNRGDYVSLDPLNSINTVAENINDNGQIVGYYQSSDKAYHGFLFDSKSGVYTPIDFNGAANTEALGINNNGTIVGTYWDNTGVTHGFVRTSNGQLSTVDYTANGTTGTVIGGINNQGDIVGWFTGTDGHDHAFTGTLNTPTLTAPTSLNLVANSTTSILNWLVAQPPKGATSLDLYVLYEAGSGPYTGNLHVNNAYILQNNVWSVFSGDVPQQTVVAFNAADANQVTYTAPKIVGLQDDIYAAVSSGGHWSSVTHTTLLT